MDRRNFLKYAGTGSIAATAALYGCKPESNITTG
ncbi:MAG: twin-arginine translocation signal domain-containing protein, partial [Planctomycetaceae bacterium]|nr:twin-arginine translocation signal domain-containing protein [Planctomycetaceae bacterium]